MWIVAVVIVYTFLVRCDEASTPGIEPETGYIGIGFPQFLYYNHDRKAMANAV